MAAGKIVPSVIWWGGVAFKDHRAAVTISSMDQTGGITAHTVSWDDVLSRPTPFPAPQRQSRTSAIGEYGFGGRL